MFKDRTVDIFKQNWHSEIQSNSQCKVYSSFKDDHAIESYLKELPPEQGLNICKFRLRVHHFPITNARFTDALVDVNCPLCDIREEGDEIHYLYKCPYFKDQRSKILHQNFTNSQIKHHEIFNSDMYNLIEISKFVKQIMKCFRKKTVKATPHTKKPKISRFGRRLIPTVKLDL